MQASYFMAWLLSNTLFRTYFRMRVRHPERVPAHGPVILASNHASYVDPFAVGAALPRDIHYLAKESLFANPILNRLLRSWNAVPVNREGGGAAGLRAIFDRLESGGGIVLFPEGTRTLTGELQPARSGIGLVVLKSACPVVPVRVFGTYAAYGRARRVPVPLPIMVKFGQPLMFSEERCRAAGAGKQRLKPLYQQVADTIMQTIRQIEPCRDVDRFP